MRYLLAAEADRIQDFIFRSSRLREVVGASQLLTRFCDEGAPLLLEQPKYGGDRKRDLVVNDGGSFRILFDDRDKAKQFGADLAELYRLTVDGAISVAEPVAVDGDFRDANKAAGNALRRAKSHRVGAVAEAHMPYAAFCASCGVGLAEQHGRLADEPSSVRPRYLCLACQTKALERSENKHTLLGQFLEEVVGSATAAESFEWPKDADEVGVYDARNYVAYLVADGNNMGQLFDACISQHQISGFSTGLTPATRCSLAAPTRHVMQWSREKKDWLAPVLPLILGGDDLFALIPAPYALDFARRFCLAYEDQLKKLVDEIKLTAQPTVAAAVVICKSKYPYTLAHRRAEELLKQAKRQCKLLAAETGEQLSAVNFEVILGNRLAGLEDEGSERRKAVRATLRPYWVVRDGATLSPQAEKYGLDLRRLLEQRWALKNVPNKRLIELRKRFESLPPGITVTTRQEALKSWTAGLELLLKRSGRETGAALRATLATLGQPFEQVGDAHHWRELQRNGDKPLSHGMLDLLEMWDFAQDLDKGPDEYEPKEGEE